MTDLIDNEIFEEVESLLMDQSLEIQGNGLSYDIESFQNVRKFLNLLNEKYHTGLGVVEGKYKIKGLSESEVERIYKEATGSSLKYGQILKDMQLLIFFLDEIKIRGAPIFSELHKKATKFSKFLNKMHEQKVGKQYNELLTQVETKFNDFYQVLEFYIQDSIGYKPHNYKQSDDDFEEHSTIDFTTKLLEIRNLLKSIRVIEKNGLPKLMQKYLDYLNKKHIDKQQWETIVRIVNQFPIHLQGKNMKPEQLREYLIQISSFVVLNQSSENKDEFVEKIKILFQKVLDKKMEGGNRIVDEQQRREYKRKIAVEIFRFNIQGYYSQIFTHFNDLIQQKHMGSIHDMSGNLRSIIIDLEEIFILMQDSDFLQEDLRAFITILRTEEDIIEQDNFKEGLRFKFTYIKQQLDNAIETGKSGDNAEFVEEFFATLKKISGVFNALINYLKSLEHRDFDITEMEISDFSRLQAPHALQVTNDIDQLIKIVQQFINTSYMYNNIQRTKKELESIDLNKYQDESIKIFMKAKNDMTKYYADIQAFYAKEDVIYNPTLAMYMKEVLLKFHSCLYISNGVSDAPILNPRYLTRPFDENGQALMAVALIPAHKQHCQFVGLTEELGAKQFKQRAFYPYLANPLNPLAAINRIVPPVTPYIEIMPQLPEQLTSITNSLLESTVAHLQGSTTYTQLKNYGDLFDIIQPINDPLGNIPDNGQRLVLNQINLKALYNDLQLQRLRLHPRQVVNRPAGPFPLPAIQHGIEPQGLITFLQNVQIRPPRQQLPVPGQVPAPESTKIYLNLDNNSLKEYLIPEIQVPFIQPMTHLRGLVQARGGNAFKQFQQIRQLTINMYPSNQWHWNNYIHPPQPGYNAFDMANPAGQYLNYDHQHQFMLNQYYHSIPSLIGIQNSFPIQYTPKGILGNNFETRIQQRIQTIRHLSNLHAWSYFDRVPPNRFNNHGNQIQDCLNLPNPANQLILLQQKQYSTIFPVDQSNGCQIPCNSIDCPVLKNKNNQIVEYYMYMNQHLQYFGIQSPIAIYDPMIRKQIFTIANKVYTGQDIIPGIGPRIIMSSIIQAENTAFNGGIDPSNLYFNLTRPFGPCKLIGPLRTRTPINVDPINYGTVINEAENSQRQLLCGTGLYKEVPSDIIESQPRVAIPVILQKATNNSIRNEFIDLCILSNPNLIENGILRVDKTTIDTLLSVVDKRQEFRCYLSRCIQIQYFNNYMLMQKQPQLQETQVVINQNTIGQRKVAFLDLVRQVVSIKQLGNAALIVLTDTINKSINEQLKVVGENKLDYKSVIDQLNTLIMIYRQSAGNPTYDYFNGQLSGPEIEILRTGTRYLNNYIHNTNKQPNFYNNKHEMIGGNKNFDEYFNTIQKYVQLIKQVPHNMPIIENFISLFTLIANNEGSANNMNKDTIKRLVSEYIISSMIDISESVLEFDFNVEFKYAQGEPINPNIPIPSDEIQYMQLVIDTRQNKSLKLITPDCIFVPFEYKKSKTLVPQFASLITRDFDQLFNQLMNAMTQRMINHVSMYQLMFKKRYDDQDMVVGRIMLGSKKRSKSQSQEQTDKLQISNTVVKNRDTFNLSDRDLQLNQVKFELYFRVFLLICYYQDLFDNLMVDIQTANGGQGGKFVNYYFQVDQSKNEGKLITIVERMREPMGPGPIVRRGRTKPFTAEMLKKFIEIVNRIFRQNNMISNDQMYQHMVSFVNLSFGVATNNEITALNQVQPVANLVNVNTFFNQIETPIYDITVTDPRLASLNQLLQKTDDPENTVYVHINNLIKKTVQRLQEITEQQFQSRNQNNIGLSTNFNMISKYVKVQYSLLKLKNATPAEVENGLLYIFNNYYNQTVDNVQFPILCHEQLLFAIEIYNQVWVARKLQEEMKRINPLDSFGWNAGTRHFDNVPAVPAVNNVSRAVPDKNVDYHTNLIHKFINKLSDMQSVFPSNLVNITIKQARLQDATNPPVVPVVAGVQPQLMNLFNFDAFYHNYVNISSTGLVQKMKQLRNIITTLSSGNQFRQHINHLMLPPHVVGQPIVNVDINDLLLGLPDMTGLGINQNSYQIINQKSLTNIDIQKIKQDGQAYMQDKMYYTQRIQDNEQPVQQPKPILIAQKVENKPVPIQNDIITELTSKYLPKTHILIPVIESQQKASNLADISKYDQQLGDNNYKIELIQMNIKGYIPEINISENDNIQQFIQDILEGINQDKDQISLINYMLENTSGKTSGWYSYLLINRNQIEEDRFIEDNILIPNTKTPLIQMIKSKDPIQQSENKWEMQGNGAIKGRGLGSDDFIRDLPQIGANVVLQNVIRNNNQKLHLQEDFMNQHYIVYTAYKQELNEIFVFNRIFKEFFQNCSQLIGHTDLLGKLFNDAIMEFRSHLSQYQGIHNREIKMSKITENLAILQQQQGLPPLATEIDAQAISFALQNLTNQTAQGIIQGQANGMVPNLRQELTNRLLILVPREYLMFLVDSLAARIYSNITQRNLNDPAPQDIQDIINHIVPVSPNDLKNRNNLKEHKQTISVRENAVMYSELVTNILYDGYNQKTDEFTFMETEVHNQKQLVDDQLPNVSLVTSSIFNFFMQWNLSQELSKIQPVDLLTQLNMKFNHEDLQILVSNAVFTKFQLVNLIKNLSFKKSALDQMAKNFYQDRMSTVDNPANDLHRYNLEQMRNSMIVKSQLLQRLIIFIQHKIIFALDIVINNKHSVLPALLSTGRAGIVQQPLLSNLKYLFQYKQQLQKLHLGNIQSESEQFKLTFAKYLYVAMHDPDNMMTQLKIGDQFDYVTRFHSLITDMSAGMYSLQNTLLNRESQLSKALLFIPQPDLFKTNPEQFNNIYINQKYLQVLSNNNSTLSLFDLDRYMVYIFNNINLITEIFNQLYVFQPPLQPGLQILDNIDNVVQKFNARPNPVVRLMEPDALLRSINIPQIMKLGYLHLYRLLEPQYQLLENYQYTRPQIGANVDPQYYMDDTPLVYDPVRLPRDCVLPIALFGAHRQSRLYQNVNNIQLDQAIPSNNPLIFELIVGYMSPNIPRNDMPQQNIIQMGIVPLNMNMLRRDTGLVNISLYANAFQTFLNQINRPAGNPRGDFPIALFDGSRIDLNINNIMIGYDPQRGIQVPDLLFPQAQLLFNIVNQGISVISRQPMGVNAAGVAQQPSQIITKFDMINQSMQFRVALALYLILKKMLGGVLVNDKDVRLKGIEAIITGQLLDNPDHRRQF